MVNSFIFDFDGVLVDSAQIRADGYLDVLLPEYVAFESEIRRYVEIHGGVSRFEKFRYIFERIINEDLTEKRSDRLCEAYAATVRDRVARAPEIPGIGDFLKNLNPNCSAYVVSGSPEIELRGLVAARPWGAVFSEVLGSPTPKNIQLAALIERRSIAPDNAVFFGDSITDAEAAIACHIEFVGIGKPWSNAPGKWYPDFKEIDPGSFSL
jgi:phosphoglycolate phosphatase-like HAD superfamily hydrolase